MKISVVKVILYLWVKLNCVYRLRSKLGVLYNVFIFSLRSTCFGTTPSSGAQLYRSCQWCVDSFWFCLFHVVRYWLGHPRTFSTVRGCPSQYLTTWNKQNQK